MKKLLVLSSLMLALSINSAKANETPLLMEGKTTLYQRVLTTPSCKLYKDASDSKGKKVATFSRYYVYDRQNGKLKVGADTLGNIAGFLDDACTVDWKAQTALMFTNPANRNRAIIFDSDENLNAIVDADDPKALVVPIYQSIQKNNKADHVVAMEPEKFVDFKKQFYLLPILDWQETMFADGFNTNVLKIASVTDEKGTSKTQNNSSNSSGITAFKAAIVFVIDSSISMQPYIDRTKKTIEAVYNKLEKEGLADSVNFGLVSFRSNTNAVPKLEYTSKMFVNPGEVSSAKEFNEKVKSLAQAKVSSALFDEDAYSGIENALQNVEWQNYGGRYIILITDAGAIEGSNKLSTTKLDAKELRLEAEHHNAAIYTLHLLTNAGKKNNNHDKAKAQYEELSFNQILQKPLYYSVDAGDVNAFGSMIDKLSNSISNQVKLASEGKLAAGTPTKDDLDSDTYKIGYAMQLAFLGSVENIKSPNFLEGWIADRDLVNHNMPTSQPIVLLTRSQLSDLKDVVSKIAESVNIGMLAPDAMFSELKSIAASLGRDPNTIKDSNTVKISELGLLGEYLDDLPYKSEIANLDVETFTAMGPEEQDNLIRNLESKLNYYQTYHDDTTRWISLSENEDPSEAVYPVPLEALP